MRFARLAPLIMAVLIMAAQLPVARAQGPSLEDMFDLRVYYGPEAADVVTLSLNLGIVNADGTIDGTLTIKSNSDLTYALLPQVSGISGPGADQLAGRAFPQIVGQSAITTERIRFSKTADINLTLGKFGVVPGDALPTFTYHALSLLLTWASIDRLPSTMNQLKAADVAALVERFGITPQERATFTTLLERGEIVNAAEIVLGAIGRNGDIVHDFLRTYVKVDLSPFAIERWAKRANLLVKMGETLDFYYELATAPDRVVAQVRAVPLTRSGTDVMIVVDRSGSMAGSNILGAKRAAKLYVQRVSAGDSFGVVSFSSGASLVQGLAQASDATRSSAIAAIDAIGVGGSTSIGAGLQLALQEFTQQGGAANRRIIVLLTDGAENAAPYVKDVLPGLQSNNVSVIAIGLGSAIDEPLLQGLSNDTYGSYRAVSDPGRLAATYNKVASQSNGESIVQSGSAVAGPAAQSQVAQVQAVTIDGRRTTFSVTWADSARRLSLSLVDPQGRRITPADVPSTPGVTYTTGDGFATFSVLGSQPGVWTMETTLLPVTAELADASLLQEGLTYDYLISTDSDLRLAVEASAFSVQPGEPITLQATLFSSTGRTPGAALSATVGGVADALTLLDDGQGPDRAAGDGVYTGQFTAPVDNDTFPITVRAASGGLTREAEVFYTVNRSTRRSYDLWALISGPAGAMPGSQITYEVWYGNDGPNSATSGRLEVALPAEVSFVSSSLGAPTSQRNGTLVWTAVNAPFGSLQKVNVIAQVSPAAKLGATLTATVSLAAPAGTTETLAGNNRARTVTTLGLTDSYLPLVLR